MSALTWRRLLATVCCLVWLLAYVRLVAQQQLVDADFKASVEKPAYTRGGPTVAIDEAHSNFHTAGGQYKPFADLLTADGYRVIASTRRVRALRGIPVLSLTDAATRLAKELVRQGALPKKATVDAFHIGVAAAHQVTYLLTWNCKHLANATMRGTIESVCRSEGLRPPIICTPEELPARKPS